MTTPSVPYQGEGREGRRGRGREGGRGRERVREGGRGREREGYYMYFIIFHILVHWL